MFTNIDASIQILFCVSLVVILIFCAVSDIVRYLIPNYASVLIFLLFVVSLVLSPAGVSPWSHFGAGLTVLLVGLVLFRFGLFGGGDVKLWAAVATWYGFAALPAQLAYVCVIGGLIGITLLLARTLVGRCRRFSNAGTATLSVPRLLQGDAPVPYGVAISAGTILTLDRVPSFATIFG